MNRTRMILLWLLAAIYVVAGILHVAIPQAFMRIVPSWMPLPHATVIVTGLCEIAGAVGLMIPRLRRIAAAMLALYAVCVFPANIKHMLDFAASNAARTGWFYHGPRMLLQPLIVWWTLFAAHVIDWPFGQSQRQA